MACIPCAIPFLGAIGATVGITGSESKKNKKILYIIAAIIIIAAIALWLYFRKKSCKSCKV